MIMRARNKYLKTDLSGPLKAAFQISDTEFDLHYRNFMRKYKQQISEHYSGKLSPGEKYLRNDVISIEKGGKYRVDAIPQGRYSGEIRGFRQAKNIPMNLVLVLDGASARHAYYSNIVPVDKYKTFPKGAFIPALSEDEMMIVSGYRNILEIHGAISEKKYSIGYTLYVFDQKKGAGAFPG